MDLLIFQAPLTAEKNMQKGADFGSHLPYETFALMGAGKLSYLPFGWHTEAHVVSRFDLFM